MPETATPTPAPTPAAPPYVGPKSTKGEMICGCAVDDLGLQILLGPSKICDGLGLFVALDDGVESTLLTKGTPVCGYSKGSMVPIADGTFTVAYVFFGTLNGVIFNQRLMPLVEAIGLAADATGATDLRTLVAGHELLWDARSEEINIVPLDDYEARYFIPDMSASAPSASSASASLPSVTNMGMYANDCAYGPSVTEEQYIATSRHKNVLQIAWRMDIDAEGRLAPTWPVVILLKDVLFDNKEPMEVGLQYSWKYWEAARILDAEKEAEQRD